MNIISNRLLPIYLFLHISFHLPRISLLFSRSSHFLLNIARANNRQYRIHRRMKWKEDEVFNCFGSLTKIIYIYMYINVLSACIKILQDRPRIGMSISATFVDVIFFFSNKTSHRDVKLRDR